MAGMTTQRKGYLRDNEVIALIEKHGALNTDQIVSLLFRFPYGRRKAQQRLLALCKRKVLKRIRLSIDSPYIYFINKYHGRPEHLIGLNWIYVWFQNNLASGIQMYFWGLEQDFKLLQCDALCGIKNSFAKDYEWYFVEMERDNNYKFDKVQKYNNLYDQQEQLLSGKWWWQHATRFPKIIVVVESTKKLKEVKECIERYNRNNLRFDCKLLSDIIEGADWIG